MNTRIFSLIDENLKNSFNLPKYNNINDQITIDTNIGSLPWSPARLRKFKDNVSSKLQLDIETLDVTVKELVSDLDSRYMHRFFGEIWQPKTEIYQYSGWALVDGAKKGLGIVQLPNYYIENELRTGELVPVLTSYQPDQEGVWGIYPPRQFVATNVRVLLDYLVAGLE